jgi:hypothetical protein
VTKKDAYPLPRIDDVLDALGFGGGKVFSTLDLASGYWHIPIDDEDNARKTREDEDQTCPKSQDWNLPNR